MLHYVLYCMAKIYAEHINRRTLLSSKGIYNGKIFPFNYNWRLIFLKIFYVILIYFFKDHYGKTDYCFALIKYADLFSNVNKNWISWILSFSLLIACFISYEGSLYEATLVGWSYTSQLLEKNFHRVHLWENFETKKAGRNKV